MVGTVKVKVNTMTHTHITQRSGNCRVHIVKDTESATYSEHMNDE